MIRIEPCVVYHRNDCFTCYSQNQWTSVMSLPFPRVQVLFIFVTVLIDILTVCNNNCLFSTASIYIQCLTDA